MHASLSCPIVFYLSFVACVYWVPISASNPTDSLVPSSDNANVTYRYIGCTKSEVSGNLVIGKSNGREIEYLENKSRVRSTTGHVLEQMQHCNLNWVTYNAGYAIPEGAVVNDYSDDPSYVLYVIRSTYNEDNNTPVGYYDTNATTGFISGTVNKLEVTEMEMLIIT